ncbi:unnamed protein product, partial [Dovyalis caffra]
VVTRLIPNQDYAIHSSALLVHGASSAICTLQRNKAYKFQAVAEQIKHRMSNENW